MRQLLDCELADVSEPLIVAGAVREHPAPGSHDTATHLGQACECESGKRIFVVDDYPGLAEAAKFVLETEGYEVMAFRQREMALSALVAAEVRPSLLITDYLGGAMSGLGLIKICKAVHPRLKALMVSGVDYRALSRKELLLVDGALNKPYSTAELLDQVHRLCGVTSRANGRWL